MAGLFKNIQRQFLTRSEETGLGEVVTRKPTLLWREFWRRNVMEWKVKCTNICISHQSKEQR